jgi:ribonucleases P/MRP protein subunit RPP40
MDLSAAIDTLDRKALLKKLSFIVIKGHVLSLLESYFHLRTQSVRIGDIEGNVITTSRGVPQGSILGPFLFNILMLDSPLISSSRIKFADDNTIYKSCKRENLN